MRLRETAWRCESCGKWSHAKRKPSRHQVLWTDALNDPQEEIIAREVRGIEWETGAPDYAFWVWCGPFAKWEAWRA